MKKILSMIFAPMLLFATGCQEEYYEIGALPDASVIDITVECNQETNYVTFTFNNEGMLPVYYFDDGEVSSALVISKLFPEAGTYNLEVKAMDPNGISENSKTITFTLDNTFVDEALVSGLCGGLDSADSKSWVWNKSEAGHFGCAPSGSTTGTDWWSASASTATDGMYDDVMTFSVSGAYHYSPGADGKVSVNEGVTLSTFTVVDGLAATSEADGTWSVKYDGDTTYIQLSANMLAGYLPYDSLYGTPIFKFVSVSDDLLVMIADSGDISWRYEFIPQSN